MSTWSCLAAGGSKTRNTRKTSSRFVFQTVKSKLGFHYIDYILAIADYEAQLATLPVRQCDSLAYKHRKENLEREIYELDEAIKTFSKRKVYVQQ